MSGDKQTLDGLTLEELKAKLFAAETEKDVLAITDRIGQLRAEGSGKEGDKGLEVVGKGYGPHGNGHTVFKATEGEINTTVQGMRDQGVSAEGFEVGSHVASLALTDADRARIGINKTAKTGEGDVGKESGGGARDLANYRESWAAQERRRAEIKGRQADLDAANRVSKDVDDSGGWSRL